MAKDTTDTIQLVAKETGFAMGRLVNPGEKFLFATKDRTGKPRKLPKWAQPADQPLPKKQVGPADLKPKDAQVAVAGKRAELAGDAKPETTAANKAPDGAGDLA